MGKTLEINEMVARSSDVDDVGKWERKLMTMKDEQEFVDMVILFARKKAMTVINIIEAVQKVISYMDNNAILQIGTAETSTVPTEISKNGTDIEQNPEQLNTNDQNQIH